MSRIFGGSPERGEDCLYLNVWTPAKSAGDKLPVMVWVYGGSFFGGLNGSPAYDGFNFAKKGAVMVSLAYRVGVFGFLAHPELSSESGKGSGNYGLEDQIAGLKWVQQNIAGFGGDPSRVTIFGESAGGISVSMLAASPAAKGLFQRAISESGDSFAPPRYDDEGGESVFALKVANHRGWRSLRPGHDGQSKGHPPGCGFPDPARPVWTGGSFDSRI
jgi:para-nitrobenzyl esterase